MAELTINTPEWWQDRLLKKFAKDYPQRALNGAVYDTQLVSAEYPSAYSDVYRRLLRLARTPWGRLVVDIVSERLKVKGFQIGDSTATDAELWDLFRINRMDALQRQVHREALAIGTSYVSVWEDDEKEAQPKMVFESGMSMTHEAAPGDPNETSAAQKVWYDTVTGLVRCTLYLPDATYKWASAQGVDEAGWRNSITREGSNINWAPAGEVVENETGVVPIVPFVTRPDWEGYGNSDLEDLHDTIARIDHLTANTLLAIELGALRQKWATGLEIPEDPDTGEAVEPFKVALDRLWVSEDPETKFGSFEQTDVRPYLQAISDAIGQLSAVSRIPTLYFNQSDLSNPPSAASLEASETGLINKVRERADRFAESWETVASLGAWHAGRKDVRAADVFTLWTDPRTRSEAQTVDAATKLNSIGLPWEATMEFIGYSPTEIERLKAQRAGDTFQRLLNSPIPTATPVETPGRVTEPPAPENDGAS